ncbi:SCO1 protein homolog AltName: Full=BsSco [Fibrisoma limi BUZ 3]|uniref:WGS project CAIT00000000 data, contig 9 n=1 Tax=Fibrisoma limi BUZ 3 TaxID=1185876 RepID=I2GMI2_9BACT|nr:SCO family protein [Fibrisoma limi]CCH55110.1 SCO1 protein homolog AltName: Full=BsSco [Fibrisoma limi BUZ 3]
MQLKQLLICISLLAGLAGCALSAEKLPVLGEPQMMKKMVDGKEIEELVYPTIPDFSFTNQEGKTVTQRDVDGKIYVADFFFVTCPTICPIMKKNMLEVYQAYKDSPDVRIISHTIDPEHDTPAVLKQYAQDIGVTGDTWQFVTGNRETIYDIGEHHYLVTAKADSTAPGGYIHSGAFVLVDKEKHIRGMYDGTTEEGTKKLIADIKKLRDEYR